MSQTAAKLGVKQLAAIEALLTFATRKDAAQAAGVDRKTLQRWLANPTFAAELRAAESAVMDEASRRLLSIANDALTVIDETLKDTTIPPSVRLRAAESILDRLAAWQDRDLERRIVALEERLGAR